ncbi:protein NLRC3-like isoform X2 [Montipora foliosa]|uniref:protein NLRC3-like isoform X2 n=1 Tax=Montipora foliosa TaxID=591990 RepID=UPI0035F16C55
MASASWQQSQELNPNKVQVTILASEWGSSKGGLSTISRELAIQLAKFPEVQITYFLPKCSYEDKSEAHRHGITILEATRLPGYDELEWLSFPPEHLRIDVVVGHGVKLGRQAQVIRNSHKCKWIQVIHTDPEELGMFKCYENPISRAEEKHNVEVELCELSNFVVAIGPKLAEAFRKYLRCCKKDQDVFDFTPGILDEFVSVQQVPEERKLCSVLVFGRGDAEDFELKGFDIAARSVAALPDTHLVFVGAPDGKHEAIANRFLECGIPKNHLKVRGYVKARETLKRLFCEVDIVLMPSRTEGFGLTGLEALSAGLSVIVSKNSGFGDALGNVPFGSSFVIDSEDPNAWAAAIKDIWNKNRQTRLGEAKVLRDSYGMIYSWSEQCKDLLKKMINSLNDISLTDHGLSPKKALEEEEESKEHADVSAKEQTHLLFTSEGFPSSSVAFHRREDNSCEPQMPSEAQGKLKRKSDISFTDHDLSQKKARGKEKESKQHSDERRQVLFTSESCPSSSLASHRMKATSSCQSDIIESIRQIYQKCEGVVCPVPWCEWFSFQLENIFTRLKIVAKEKTRGTLTKEITNMTSIFTSHEDCQHPRIVLIEGEPGMGKTTYCQKLAYDWATKQDCEWDESFPKVEVLLLLRCREIDSSIWESIDNQILPEEIDPELKETFFRFVRENPSKVLLVLDGLDEADPQKLAVYFSLLRRRLLPGCHIVLTSRHEAGSKVRPYSDTLLEIVGFTSSDAKCFIRKYFRNAEQMAEKLIKVLWYPYDDDDGGDDDDDDDQHIDGPLAELTKNPLNTLLLCVLFEDYGGILPNNRTQLYVEIVLFVLRRYEMKNHLPSSGKDLLIVYKKELMTLGKMAQESLLKGELHFEDVEGNFMESLFIKFGFLSIQAGGSKRTPGFRYSFFHKSFQEFFSGLHLAFSILDGAIEQKSVLTDERYFHELNQVFMFMSGIIASQSEETAVSIVNGVASLANVRGRRSPADERLYLKMALDVIEECKTCSENLYTKLTYSFGKSLDLTKIRMYFESRTSIAAFSQALAVNTSLTTLHLCKGLFGAEGATSLSQALAVNTSITTLNLSRNSIGAEGATSLSQAVAVNTSLTTLDLSDNGIRPEGATSLSQALAVNTSLTTLNLSRNSIGAEGATSLSKALAVNTSLTTLNLSWNSIGAEGATSLFQALAVNTSLTTLDLHDNSIGDEGATSLFQALAVNTSLTTLDLHDNSIGDEGATSLSQALAGNSSLTTLDLHDNSIGDEGATSLSQAVAVNTSLTTLNLSRNSIGAEGATSLFQALAVNTSLTTLNLSWNSIGAEGATSVSQALAVDTSLTTLHLFGNSIGDAGATSVSQALAVNTSLTTLDLHDNSIGDEGATSLSQALAGNSSLTTLNLSRNSIGAEGATSLSQAVAVNTSLTTLNLSHNSIGAEGATSLSQALAVNTSLTTLRLFGNSIGAEGATSLSQALALNTSLTTLNLSRNSIGDAGATSLSQALAVNTSLTTLNLSGNSIGAEGATSLSQALAVNTSLTTLNLFVNSIRAEGATSLSQALAVNTSLTTLHLSGKSIGAEGVTSLSQALAVNTSLTTLYLFRNPIGARRLSLDSRIEFV